MNSESNLSAMKSSFDLENGLLCYANPNYQLIPSDPNCNVDVEEVFDDLYEDLDIACKISSRQANRNRRQYASLDPSSMGVDVELETASTVNSDDLLNHEEPVKPPTQQDVFRIFENSNVEFNSNDNTNMGKRSSFLEYYINLEAASQSNNATVQSIYPSNECIQKVSEPPIAEKDYMTLDCKKIVTKGDIQHIQGAFNKDLYAVPHKININHDDHHTSLNIPIKNSENTSYQDSVDNDSLPAGWEKHEDENGPYYWHISSGTIQREPPLLPYLSSNKSPIKMSRDSNESPKTNVFCLNSCKTKSCGINMAEHLHGNSLCIHTREEKMKRKSFPDGSCCLTHDKRPIRFAVRSLGWVEIAETDLTPERSSKAVNKCIIDLSMGRNDILDVVGRWGDGKDLFMDLDDYSLRLMETQDMTILNTQPIHTIRVWGVGRDNGRERDFAYVARDRVTKKHMCHVFRCDIPARIIANTLRDICKKIMIERSLQHNLTKLNEKCKGKHGDTIDLSRGPVRPTNLPMEQPQFQHCDSQDSFLVQSFPTPMEEPKKVLKVHYLGSVNVDKATGVEVLNDAIELLSTSVPVSEYKHVIVAVAPSTITISESGENGKQLAECRVRFLSFLGIGKDVKHCGFIVHTAKEEFVAHIFYCEPSSGALCKTIEAACKLRYQKCLDAHKEDTEKKNCERLKNKGIGTTLKSVFGTFFATRLTKSTET